MCAGCRRAAPSCSISTQRKTASLSKGLRGGGEEANQRRCETRVDEAMENGSEAKVGLLTAELLTTLRRCG